VKQVHVAQTAFEAHLVKSMLEERGIEAIVQNEMLGQATGDLPIHSIAITVCVLDDARADEARRLVEEMPKDAEGDEWTCASCGEENGPAFEVCWSCGKAR